jgi:hypothetical protein
MYKVDLEAVRLRELALRRRLASRHGDDRAFMIIHDSDSATNLDLRRWRTLGCDGLKLIR